MSASAQSPARDAPSRVPALLTHWAVRLVMLIAIFAALTGAWLLLAVGIFGTLPLLVSLLGATVAAVSAIVVVTRLVERRQLAAIGLDVRDLLPHWLGGFALGTALIAACIGVLALVGGYRITRVHFALAPLAMAFLAQVLVGLWEELLFRGILFRLLEEGLGSWLALLLSAALFGAVHLANANATVWGAVALAIEAGLFLGAAYMLTRSLWFVAGVHTAWNVVQGPVFGSVVSGSGSGGERYRLFQPVISGPELLTGGAFGIEASLVTVVLGLSLAIWFAVQAMRHNRTLRPLLWRGGMNQLPSNDPRRGRP